VELAHRQSLTGMVLSQELIYLLAKTTLIMYLHTPSGNSMAMDCRLEVEKWSHQSVTGHLAARVIGWHTSGMMMSIYES
jgi:hypothetical protein